MNTRQAPSPVTRFGLAALMAFVCALGAVAAAPPYGSPDCTVAALAALAIPDMTIVSAAEVPAALPNPSYCQVLGSVATRGGGVPDGSAAFEVRLPENWNRKFLFFGVGGTGGSPSPYANPLDIAASLIKGYATAVTDTGHVGFLTDANWALTAPGVPDKPKLIDYYYRAAHDVTTAARQLVEAFFDARIERAYFDGCSNGGRMGLVEAARYPNDYDGIIAGAPFMDMRVTTGTTKTLKQLLTADSYIPASKLPAIDAAIHASCDAADGLTDGLIQNPAACAFDPGSLVPGVLTQAQADTLQAYVSATRDRRGRLVFPGFTVSDLNGNLPFDGGMNLWTTGIRPPSDFGANEPWGTSGRPPLVPVNWLFADNFLKFIIERDPVFDLRDFDVSTDGVIGEAALRLLERRTDAGAADVPARLGRFIERGRKLLMYHGFSDPALPPFRTVKFYEDLAALTGGYRELQESVRLFMVPGMQHCGGGPGPNVFDTLSALEDWVERGIAPNGIMASHFANGNPAAAVDRTMPLCKFPAQATYLGTGDVNDGANWSCAPNRALLRVQANGIAAGLGGDQRVRVERDEDDRQPRPH